MKKALFALLTVQYVFTGAAVIFNAILFIIILNSKAKMGNYKYLMKTFTVFEALFAIVCLIGMPMHSISDHTWIEFTYYGILGQTRHAILGPVLYCLMYELWLGFIILHFFYRYIVLCKPNLALYIEMNRAPKIKILFLVIFYIIICIICSLFMCPYDTASQKLMSEVKNFFELPNKDHIGYYVIRLTTLDGAFSFVGLFAMLVHYLAVAGSTIVVVFCSVNIWRSIRDVQALQENSKLKLERQLFFTLLVQTIVPVFLTHIPSIFMLSFPLWDNNVTIGPISSLFPLFLTATKVIDPIVPIICINEYRKTLNRLLGKKEIVSRGSAYRSCPTNVQYLQNHPSFPLSTSTNANIISS